MKIHSLLSFTRSYAKLSFIKSKPKVSNPEAVATTSAITQVHPTTPVRARFAPSPTGFLHLGSLRTALYNYLLAKNTKGSFILRIEDTDRTRLVEGAETNIYNTLKWCGLKIDEGPIEGGEYGPYRQSERKEIYKKYADMLLEKGLAYKCYCSKERLNHLTESAKLLKPPTNVTYDRKCLHTEEDGPSYVIRFKSPEEYDPIVDLLHGTVQFQPQYNYQDRRYDDFVIVKTDGMPTYHFANVVDDHLMKITHVVRGEEWLPSTPKHYALYKAFGWTPPAYVHIPLLTSLKDKKLLKRLGDLNIFTLKDKGVLPEALINFVALFGWAPVRETPGESVSEVMKLEEIVEKFSIDHLTKGNAKVSDSKLYYFNKHHLFNKLNDPIEFEQLVDEYYPKFSKLTNCNKDYFKKALKYVTPNLTTMNDFENHYMYLFQDVDLTGAIPPNEHTQAILEQILKGDLSDVNSCINKIVADSNKQISKKDVFLSLRYAISGRTSGLSIPQYMDLLGLQEIKKRIQNAIIHIENKS